MLYSYITGKPTQDLTVQNFARGCGAQVLHIKHFERNGFNPKCTGVVFAGILRGNAELYQHARLQGLDTYMLDHAYLGGGTYVPPYWMRVTKNGFVQNRIVGDIDQKRYKRYFKLEMQSWNYKAKKKIYVLPPTQAVQYALGAQKWLSKTISSLHAHTEGTGLQIEVREKPNQPIVHQQTGKITGRTPKSKKQENWNELLDQAYCVVAFNSNLALTALQKGVPVITTKFCAAYPLSNKVGSILNLECNHRQQLFESLSMGQFNLYEMRNGYAYKMLQQLEQVHE